MTRAVEIDFTDPRDKLQQLSLAYSSLSAPTGVSLTGKTDDSRPGTSGIVRDPNPEKKRDFLVRVRLTRGTIWPRIPFSRLSAPGLKTTLKRSSFLSIPPCVITKRQLMGSDSDSSGSPAIYAALSGSGSALFGLYRSEAGCKGSSTARPGLWRARLS